MRRDFEFGNSGRLERESSSRGQRRLGTDDLGELETIARRLRVLQPAPKPRLAEGRKKFLDEATRLDRLSSEKRPWRDWVLRPTMAFAAIALATFVLGSAVFTQISAAPTTFPTLTATPTRIATNQLESVPMRATSPGRHAIIVPVPAPVPEPVRAQSVSGSMVSIRFDQRQSLWQKL